MEKIAPPTNIMARLAPVTPRDRNSRKGTNGVVATRVSIITKMARRTTETAMGTRVAADPQEWVSVPTMA
jgi:hypothetical protein